MMGYTRVMIVAEGLQCLAHMKALRKQLQVGTVTVGVPLAA